ncbi:MAG: hypothetical protein H6838_10105 [Planctomycetes bacterium]|nr:hypothetical protein [Planctomycetota bacterium]
MNTRLRGLALILASSASAVAQSEERTPPPPDPPRRISKEACEAHLAAMKERIPAGFHAVLEPPFVVLGDGGEARVKGFATRTVRWAVTMLRKDFFADDPDKVLEVWLFAGKDSYRKHTRQLFGEQPFTPFGYYSSRHGALIMNIDTGGGTLVHEIVHPYVEANVAGCPAWINEGLGSLFEQSKEREGHIVGLTNWRLDDLQRAIGADEAVTITDLVATNDAQFYGDNSGLNYATARYLLYWLQEHGKLRGFWKDWLATRKQDPTGAAALKRALGADDLAAFQETWQAWVAKLERD